MNTRCEGIWRITSSAGEKCFQHILCSGWEKAGAGADLSQEAPCYTCDRCLFIPPSPITQPPIKFDESFSTLLMFMVY